jgi:glycosyltransferase involved in cell wall biosynthesis
VNPGVRLHAAVIHPFLSAGGGAELVAAHILRTVAEVFGQVDVWTAESEAKAEQAMRKTLPDIDWQRVRFRSFPLLRFLTKVFRVPKLFAYSFLHRFLKWTHSSAYDAVVSTYGECDFTGKLFTLAYIHYPIFHSGRSHAARLGGKLQGSPALRNFYTHLSKALAGFKELPKNGLLLTNSSWTRGEVRALTGQDVNRVLYPPVFPFLKPGALSDVVDRPQPPPFRILVLGRLEGYKGHDMIAECAKQASVQTGLRYEMVIVGRGSPEQVAACSAAVQPHVPFEIYPGLDRDSVAHLLPGITVAVSAFAHEHFGIATAELLGSGVPVLVPESGGQAEIVPDDTFIYRGREELVATFARLATDTNALTAMRQKVFEQKDRFSEDAFESDLKDQLSRAIG